MKFYKIILFISLILSIYSGTTCSLGNNIIASSPDDCENYEIEEGKPYCCYYKATENGKPVETCYPLTKAQYKDIDGTIDSIEEDGDITVDKLDCKSIYIELSILSFILLLL